MAKTTQPIPHKHVDNLIGVLLGILLFVAGAAILHQTLGVNLPFLTAG